MSSIKENRWDCSKCGTEQGNNDIWFPNDVCSECNSHKLSILEEVFLETFCLGESFRIKKENYLDKINGGFCIVEFSSCDSKEIVLSVKYGSADENGRYVQEYELILDRETLTYKI